MRIDLSFQTHPTTASTDQNSKSYPRKTVGGAFNPFAAGRNSPSDAGPQQPRFTRRSFVFRPNSSTNANAGRESSLYGLSYTVGC